jgi:hypothetical protein
MALIHSGINARAFGPGQYQGGLAKAEFIIAKCTKGTQAAANFR